MYNSIRYDTTYESNRLKCRDVHHQMKAVDIASVACATGGQVAGYSTVLWWQAASFDGQLVSRVSQADAENWALHAASTQRLWNISHAQSRYARARA